MLALFLRGKKSLKRSLIRILSRKNFNYLFRATHETYIFCILIP